MKRALLWRLGELAGNGSNLSDAEVIFGELISNVARHTPGPARLTLECAGGTAIVRISDKGRPFVLERISPPDLFAEGGRGLLLVCAMSQDVTVERTRDGNCVTAVLPVS